MENMKKPQNIEGRTKEVTNFINTKAVFKRLRTLASFLLRGKSVNFSLKIGGGSYTDGQTIVIGVSENIIDASFEELYIMLTALVAHEVQHVLSSNFQELEKYMKRLNKFFAAESVVGRISERISHSVANILEDGRIENISGKKVPGISNKIRFLRMYDWNQSRSEGVDEMSMYLNSMLFISVLGIYPKGYHEFASDEVKAEISKIKPYIIDAVQARTAREALLIAEEIITVHSKDFLLKHIEEANSNLIEFEKMMKMLEELIKDEHKNSEESESQCTGGMSIHVEPSEGSNGKSKKSKNKKPNKEEDDNEDPKSNSKKEDKDNDEEEKEGKTSAESEDKDKGESEDAEKNDLDDSNKAEGEKADDKDGKEESSKDSKDKPNSNSDDEIEANETNMNLSEGDADDYEERGRTDEEYSNVLDKMRDELVSSVKSDIKAIERESSKTSKEVDFSLDSKEITEAIGSKGFVEYSNDFDLTEQLPPEVKVMANKFKKSISNIFKNKSKVTLTGQDKGVLNPYDLYKVNMRNYNIFLEEGRKTTSNYAFYILQDGSGSMCGSKETFSSYALSVIEEGLRGIVPYKITTFNTGQGGVTHHIVKNWNDKSQKNYSINFLKYRKAGGGNYDSISIAIATKELLKRPEKDRVLIVLSDGLPASTENTKASIKAARDQGIHVVGIMFGEERFRVNNYNSYKDMYQKNIIATDPKSITTKLTQVLKSILER